MDDGCWTLLLPDVSGDLEPEDDDDIPTVEVTANDPSHP